jgi:hypothetical protein
MACGYDPMAGAVLRSLALEPNEIPRFRDAFIKDNGDDNPTLAIMTRTGGGNREDFVTENEVLETREGFIRTWDDDFDATFAYFEYEVPENDREMVYALVKALKKDGVELVQPMKRFKKAVESLNSGVTLP